MPAIRASYLTEILGLVVSSVCDERISVASATNLPLVTDTGVEDKIRTKKYFVEWARMESCFRPPKRRTIDYFGSVIHHDQCNFLELIIQVQMEEV